ncbi:MAG: hypothetical protein J5840_02390 [Lachnospiraceae bacterium]|nr:hypothetical protein [Lachnospiraceae bacterium]
MDKNKTGELISVSRVFKLILILAGLLIIGMSVFFVFRLKIGTDHAFREAKNVYMALSAVEIDYYSRGESIYDPSNYNGLSEGVAERVEQLAGNEGTYRIISYDDKKHRILHMIYTHGNYYVSYSSDNEGSLWEVKYLMPLYSYKESINP